QEVEKRRAEQERNARVVAQQQRSEELAGMIETETQRQMQAMKREKRRLREAAQLAPTQIPLSETQDIERMHWTDTQAFQMHRIALKKPVVLDNVSVMHIDRGPLLEKRTYP